MKYITGTEEAFNHYPLEMNSLGGAQAAQTYECRNCPWKHRDPVQGHENTVF